MKLSIIVPVYNTEKTLRRCVDSILEQKSVNFELLLIDDGSTDNSGLLVDEMAQKSRRITVFHKPNGGLSDARNYGLDRATGDYIAFIDSDDWLMPGTLAALTDILKKNPDYDILEYPVTERPGTDTEHLFNPGINEYADAADWLAKQGLRHCWICNKIYKRWVFDGIRFPADRRMFEDIITTGKLIKKRPFMATTDKGMYMYFWNEEGIVANSMKTKSTELLEAQIEMVKDLGIDTRDKRWHRVYMDMLSTQLNIYRTTGIILLHNQKVSLKRHDGIKDIIKALSVNVLGLRLSCRLFKLLSL